MNWTMKMNDELRSYSNSATLLKVLAHPVRLAIMTYLLEQGSANVTTLVNYTELSQPNVSQHLARLRKHNAVKVVKTGIISTYLINDSRVENVLKALSQ